MCRCGVPRVSSVDDVVVSWIRNILESGFDGCGRIAKLRSGLVRLRWKETASKEGLRCDEQQMLRFLEDDGRNREAGRLALG